MRKRCCKCHKYKDLEDYRVRAQSPDNRTSRCILCLRWHEEYRRKNGKQEKKFEYKFHEDHETLGSVSSYLLGVKL